MSGLTANHIPNRVIGVAEPQDLCGSLPRVPRCAGCAQLWPTGQC